MFLNNSGMHSCPVSLAQNSESIFIFSFHYSGQVLLILVLSPDQDVSWRISLRGHCRGNEKGLWHPLCKSNNEAYRAFSYKAQQHGLLASH